MRDKQSHVLTLLLASRVQKPWKSFIAGKNAIKQKILCLFLRPRILHTKSGPPVVLHYAYIAFYAIYCETMAVDLARGLQCFLKVKVTLS